MIDLSITVEFLIALTSTELSDAATCYGHHKTLQVITMRWDEATRSYHLPLFSENIQILPITRTRRCVSVFQQAQQTETEHTVSVVASAATRDNTTTLLNCESYITHPPENIAEEEKSGLLAFQTLHARTAAPEQAELQQNQQNHSFQYQAGAALQYTPSCGITGSSLNSNTSGFLSRDGYWSSSSAVKEYSASFALSPAEERARYMLVNWNISKPTNVQKKQKIAPEREDNKHTR